MESATPLFLSLCPVFLLVVMKWCTWLIWPNLTFLFASGFGYLMEAPVSPIRILFIFGSDFVTHSSAFFLNLLCFCVFVFVFEWWKALLRRSAMVVQCWIWTLKPPLAVALRIFMEKIVLLRSNSLLHGLSL